MTASDLIAAIQYADDKNSLEALVSGKIAIDKRKSLSTLKTEILDALQGESNTEELPRSSTGSLQLPDIDTEEEDEPEVQVVKNRVLRNTKTGACFTWTHQLAVLSHFEEI